MPFKSYKRKPKWLTNILAQKRKDGQCRICKYKESRHLVAVRTSFEKPRYKKLALYSKKDLKDELDRHSIMCTWCFRIHMTCTNKITSYPPFNPDLPCCGRLCNIACTKYPKYQLCQTCFDHHAQLKHDLYAKVNAYKRTFKQCPQCHVRIEEGNEMCFDLDHLDVYQKEHNVSHLIRRLAPFHVIKKEMEKCRLLCCHCHLDHTKTQSHIFKRQDFQNHRRKLRENGALVNPKPRIDSPESSSCEEEPEIRSAYNPLDDPSPEFKPPPLFQTT